jgi:hypothetical protein
MTRALLCWGLAAGCLALGLFTAMQQAENRHRGALLNDVMERSRMLEGITREREVRLLSADWGVLPYDEQILERAKEKTPSQKEIDAREANL